MLNDPRNILLPLNGHGDIDAALHLGLLYAETFGCHLSAVYVGDDPNETAALAGEGLSSAMIDEMMAAAEHESEHRVLQVRHSFDRFLAEHSIVRREATPPTSLPEGSRVSASLEFLTDEEYEAITWRARLSDMTLMPHLTAKDDPRSSEILHAILFDSGRPLVVAPPQRPAHAGRRICIAWNGTAEASASLRAILPWAKRAEHVEVLTSPEYQRRGPQGDKVLDYLALHGIRSSHSVFHPLDRDLGAGLLASCAEHGADMLAMGAYSHSRLRQMIIGGVTRHILEKAPIAVLMSR